MEASSAGRCSAVRFGDFELDMHSGELWKAGVRTNLQDQPLKVLLCLLEQPGHIVTRDDLRARLWGGETFVDFEQGLNAAIRRLREALGDSADSPRFVQTLPRRGYRFIATVDRENASPGNRQPSSAAVTVTSPQPVARTSAGRGTRDAASLWSRSAIAVAIAVMALVVVIAWRSQRSAAMPSLPMHVIPLTTLAGAEHSPTFSPEGAEVAFVWDGERQENTDIYVKRVGSLDVQRLTTDPAVDLAPQWSPDGMRIAFVRRGSRTSHRIRLVSPQGGSDHALNEFPVGPPAIWSRDGRYLVAARAPEPGDSDQSTGIYAIPVEMGEPRPISRRVAPETDTWPSFSPDGRRIAYANCQQIIFPGCHLEILEVSPTLAPVGLPRRLTRAPTWTIEGTAWSRDGRFVIYSAPDGAFVTLWRVPADGSQPPARIEAAGPDAGHPTTTRSNDRLAFSRLIEDEDLYQLDIGTGVSRPLVKSSVKETGAQLSPDGTRIVFCSVRPIFAVQLFVAGSDGSHPDQLTHGPGRWQCSPAWSPDSKRIAFDSQADDGSWHIWTIDAEGGVPRQVTADAGDQFRPTWSHDGKFIYFVRRHGDRRDVWRTGRVNEPSLQITHSGLVARGWEALDRSGVFYQNNPPDSGLYFQPLGGGPPKTTIECVTSARFSIGKRGIYYMPCQAPATIEHDAPVRLLNPATAEDRPVTVLKDIQFPMWSRFNQSFSVSEDGRTILYSRLVSGGGDLMLIENFK
jgi:Tol biopolymer transport system component/DNA-binding winged helix-turn-helix (wHTH) protein